MEFEDVEKIGLRIKELRKRKSITIQKLSQFTNLSVGYLSNLERNQASPTLSNLQRICVALGVSVRDLLTMPVEEKTLIRWDEARVYDYDEYNLTIRRMDFGKKRGVYEFSEYAPGDEGTPPSWGLHPYAEVGFVLEGSLEVNLEGTIHLLEQGDSIYIRPNVYHTMRNAGTTLCRSFWHLQIMDDYG
ncbi:MAG: helix-turn-helix domain-containing protein [Clostridium sp.]|jgi:transcriptional regulator with XRE-family HTH domain